MASEDDVAISSDPHDWAPMRPYRGRRSFDITDPIVEPLWSGERVLVHFEIDSSEGAALKVAMVDDFEADLAPGLPDIVEAIGRSVMAIDAVIDGVVSHQLGIDGTGAAAIPEVRGRAPGFLIRGNTELDVVARGTEPASDDLMGFIAFDLLRVDGTSLLDVPLLERARLLESVVADNELVRRSIHVRPPIDTWIATWKAMGLRGGILKAANSRYRPSDDTIEWTIVERLNRRH